MFPYGFAFAQVVAGNCLRLWGQFLAPTWAKAGSSGNHVGGGGLRFWTICLGEWVTFAMPDAHSPSLAYYLVLLGPETKDQYFAAKQNIDQKNKGRVIKNKAELDDT